ncbi:MAG: hypothetical protein JWM90_1424 [Thermoleophilia bacterium]|nr:hypothetical protein [Thermoleophilia bacterium]
MTRAIESGAVSCAWRARAPEPAQIAEPAAQEPASEDAPEPAEPAASGPDPQPAADAKSGAGAVAGPENAPATYHVKSGDTLGGIARAHGVTVVELHELNRDTVPNPDLIHPGQQLLLPSGDPAIEPVPAAKAEPTPAPEPAPAAVPEPVQAPAPVAEPAPAAAQGMILPVGDGPRSSGFGANEPFRGGIRHTGIDFPRPAGTPIKAAAGGTVIHAGWEQGGGGNSVVIDHGNGVFSRYAHQSAVGVAPGQKVRQGEPIGQVGTTGNSTGNHLHFEVLEGSWVDPQKSGVDPGPYLSGAKHVSAGATQRGTGAGDAGGRTHTVQPGDTMGAIATRLGIPLQQLIDANRATVPNPNVIVPGQVLQVG